MKRLFYLLTIFIYLGIGSSCSTVETITVHGNPGTKIYSPQKSKLATIPQTGKVKVKLPSDAYFGYLYTRDDIHNRWIPFALDVKQNKHTGTKAQSLGGLTLSSIGGLCLVIGTIAELAEGGESSTGLSLIGVGGGSALVGTGLLIPAQAKLGQLAYQYNFSYTSKQQVNSDLRLTQYTPPIDGTLESAPTRKKATSGEATNTKESSSAKTRKNSATSTAKKRKTNSELIAGEYAGTGTLVTTGENPETLGTMMIVIAPKDDNTVIADIMEDNESFFESEEIFTVKKNKDSSFTLTHTRIPLVKFTITKTGKIDYKHPKVNIDGTTYTLSISATKNTK